MKKMSSNNTQKKKITLQEKMSSFPQVHMICTKYIKKKKTLKSKSKNIISVRNIRSIFKYM